MLKRFISFVILLILVSFIPVFATSSIADPLVIEGTHKIEGNESLTSINNTYILTAIGDAPMPEGTADGVKKVVFPANSTFDFGVISFPKPGIYEYTVSRDITNSDSLNQDDSVYTIRVAVFSDGTRVVVYSKEGEMEKPDKLEYVDEFIEPEPEPEPDHVKTGEGMQVYMFGGVFLLTALVIAIICKRKK